MTWSIVARDAETGNFGIAISTCALGVGALCPWVKAGVGAVSTQSYSNPLYGPGALDRMAAGEPAEAAIRAMIDADDGRTYRQVHGVDAAGRSFAWTGEKCIDWNGYRTADGVSVAGNMLIGPQVVEATFEAWGANAGLEFPDRLLTALEAGQDVGGDARGRMSGALKVVGAEAYPFVDLRVDHHDDPVAELRRLWFLWNELRRPGLPAMARADDLSGLADPEVRAAFEARVERDRERVAGFRRERGAI